MNEFNNSFVKNFLNVPTIVKAVKIQRENDLTNQKFTLEDQKGSQIKKPRKKRMKRTQWLQKVFIHHCIFIK